MIDIVQTIREFVDELDLSGRVLSSSNNGIETTLVLENSYHLREFMPVFIDSIEYETLSVNARTNTVVLDGVVANATTYTVPSPFFFHGTKYIVNYELDNLPDTSKLPMFYMEEPIRQNLGNEDSIYIEPNFMFVLADFANFEDWQSDDFTSKRLVGLVKLAYAIRKKMFSYYRFGKIQQDINVEQLPKFGVYKKDSGVIDSIFNHTLSAVGMQTVIPISDCNC